MAMETNTFINTLTLSSTVVCWNAVVAKCGLWSQLLFSWCMLRMLSAPISTWSGGWLCESLMAAICDLIWRNLPYTYRKRAKLSYCYRCSECPCAHENVRNSLWSSNIRKDHNLPSVGNAGLYILVQQPGDTGMYNDIARWYWYGWLAHVQQLSDTDM